MKKITNLIIAIVFSISLTLAAINTAVANKNSDGKSSYATICPLPAPVPKTEKKGGGK